MKKKWIVFIIIAVVVAAISVGGGIALAYWTARLEDSAWFELKVESDNPTLKYQIFVPIDSNGMIVEGNYQVSSNNGTVTRNYVVDNDSLDSIASLALVGWEGGIALDYVIVPDSADVLINGEIQNLSVTRVLVDARLRDYYFRGDVYIKRIALASSVLYVSDGALAFMPALEEVVVQGDAELEPLLLSRWAFEGDEKLSSVTSPGGRVIIEEE